MNRRLDRLVSGAARRLASLPLKCLPAGWRAQVLQRFDSEMIIESPIPGGMIRFYAPSPLLRSRAETLLSKETDTIRWIDGFPPGAVFWDIGANVGVFSLYAAARRQATVLAFEPSAGNYHVLSRNIQINQLSDRVTGYCVALSDRTQLGVLNLAAPELGGALSHFGHRGEFSRYAGQADGVAQGMVGWAIDEFIAQFSPPFPNHLKMDVDGLELPILRGASRTLRDPRFRSLMVELSLSNEDENREATHLLNDAGWQLVASGEQQGAAGERAANHFFDRMPGWKPAA